MRLSPPSVHRPRLATPADPDCPSYGPTVARIAAALGLPLMPWQLDAVTIAGQVVTTADGPRMRWPSVVWRVPRRAGKSAAILATLLHRVTASVDARAAYTAQTRQDAAETFRDEWLPRVERSVLAPLIRSRRSNGSERMTVPRLGGIARVIAPNDTAGHGQPLDVAVVDEAWAFTLDRGLTLEGTLRPTMIDRPTWRQLYVVSAAGTEASTWLQRWVDLGAAGAPGVAVLDYGATPSDDLEDPDVWARVHPAVGHRIALVDLETDRGVVGETEFNRAYLGVTTPAITTPPKVPHAAWTACRGRHAPRPGRVAFGFDASPERDAASVVAAWRTAAGRLHLEVVLDTRDPSVLVAELVGYRTRWPAATFGYDRGGPVGDVADRLATAGVPLLAMSTEDYCAACAGLHTAILAGDVTHPGQASLDDAVAVALARPVGDRWVWARRGAVPVCALTAATVAAWTYDHTRPARAPSIRHASDRVTEGG